MNVFSKCSRLFWPASAEQPKSHCTNNRNIDNRTEAELEERARRLMDKALSCAAIKQLYDQANAVPARIPGGPQKLVIKFIKNPPWFAEILTASREILLASHTQDDYALSLFTFELTNAIKLSRYYQLHIKAYNITISSEEYAKEIKRMEFEGGIFHSKIMKIAIKELNLDPSSDNFDYLNQLDFERCWHEHDKYIPHTQYYRDQYAQAARTKAEMPGFLSKLESSRYLVTHYSLSDIKKMFISTIPGLAVGAINSSPNAAASMAIAGVVGVIAQKALRPFISSSKGNLLSLGVFVGGCMTSSALSLQALFALACGSLIERRVDRKPYEIWPEKQ